MTDPSTQPHELINAINDLIEQHGGIRKYTIMIERELGMLSPQKAGNKRIWSHSDEEYLLRNFNSMGLTSLAKSLDRSVDAIMGKYVKLRQNYKLRLFDADAKKANQTGE